MTIRQDVFDKFAAILTSDAITKVTINNVVYDFNPVLPNEPDEDVIEPFFHIDIDISRALTRLDGYTYPVTIQLLIYTDPEETVTSYDVLQFCDQIENALAKVPGYIWTNEGTLTPVGYSDESTHFLHTYKLTLTAL